MQSSPVATPGTTDAPQGHRPWLALLGGCLVLALLALVIVLSPGPGPGPGPQAGAADTLSPAVWPLALLALALGGAFTVAALRRLQSLQTRERALQDMAEQLRAARLEAEAASEAKSAFLSHMNHEIRTPFHGLMGMLSLLRESGLAPRQIDYLRSATESADHLLAVLNDILDLSQLESGRMTLAPGPTDVRALLREVEGLVRPQALARRLALHIDAAPGVPELVRLDATRAKQVVIKLLGHAIRLSDHGAVVLDLRSTQQASAGRPLLNFIITCTGSAEDAAAARGMQRAPGKGLDLDIARKLALLMDGALELPGRPGAGSRYTLALPFDVVSADAEPAAAPDSCGSPLQVLVAEDHPVNRQYMAALLESMGHQGYFTTNGQEAVQAARALRFDLVLMDLNMPVLDGILATRAIRALPEAGPSTMPIVALTADALEETRERCLVAGMNDCLTKPVSPQKLASLLRRLFGAPTHASAVSEDRSTPAVQGTMFGQVLLDKALIEMSLQAMPGARLAGMIEDFLNQGPETVQRLRAAVRDAQPLELRVNAHAARGAALNLGLAGLAATAEALHEGAAHLPAHEIARLVQRFEDQLPLSRNAVAALQLAQRPQRPKAKPEAAAQAAAQAAMFRR